jgi:uncharacterized protein (DUF58 family)
MTPRPAKPQTAPGTASPLLDPAALAGIRDLRLAARTLVEGFLAGQHGARRLAQGAEFSQFRSYGPGDDPRRIDWRLYARADRLYLREAQAERDVTVRFVLDASASMTVPRGEGAGGHGSAGGGDTATKFDLARLAAAALAYLAQMHGDAVVLTAVAGGVGSIGTAAAGGRAAGGASGRRGTTGIGIGGFLHALERLTPGGAWPDFEQLLPRLAPRRGRELVLVLSDCWEHGTELRRTLAALRAQRHEVVVLRVLAPAEIDLPPGDDTVFEDVETGARLAAAGAAIRAAYALRFAAHRDALRHDLSALGIELVELRTDQPLDAALRAFLLRRQRLP